MECVMKSAEPFGIGNMRDSSGKSKLSETPQVRNELRRFADCPRKASIFLKTTFLFSITNMREIKLVFLLFVP
jgi:hypothetical protein